MEAIGTEPLRVGAIVWQPRPGAHALTVVCKVTFQLAPGESRLAPVPAALVPFDVPTAAGEREPLAAPSDLVPFKVSPEVMIRGHAYSPGGRPVPSLLARVAVGDMDKVVSVHGDRCFSPAGELHEALPFTRMPLGWDRAAGGPDTANPAGVVTGPVARPDATGRVHLPNLQAIGRYFPSRSEVLAPAGLGPVAASWPGRRQHLGPHAATWDALRWSERPLPQDFGGAYFQAAPPDQRVSDLPPDARLFLEGLSPHHPQLATRLPPVVPGAIVETAGTRAPLRLRCDTLWIDTDAELAVLVYRGSVPLDHPHREGRVLVTPMPTAVSAAVPRGPDPAPEVAESEPVERSAQPVLKTMLGGMGGPALPFETDPGEIAAMVAGLPPEMQAKMSARLAELGDLSRVSVSGTTLPVPAARPVIPFAAVDEEDISGAPDTEPPPPPGAELDAAAEPDEDDTADTHRPPPPAPPAGFVIPAAWASAGFSVKETFVLPEAAPPPETAPHWSRAREQADPSRAREQADPSRAGSTDLPEPPAMIGPLAKAEPDRSPDASPASPEAPETADPAPPAEAEEPLSIDDYPIERYARIAASVDLHEAESARILGDNGLSPATWERLRQHWNTTVNNEAARGKSTSMRAHDAAYVAQLEAERGPVELHDYAVLVVAMDRGTVDEALAAVGLPRRSAMPIRRVWTARVFKDPKLAARVRQAVTEERERP